jgi:hypothetical protein
MANQDMLAFLGGAGSGLSRAAQTDLARAGLSLDEKDLRVLDQRRRTSLGSLCRVELGGSALSVIVETFADSPYLEQDRLAEQLGAIQDAFYELRDQVPVGVADARVAAALREVFDAAQGDSGALLGLAAANVCEPEELGTEDAWEHSPWRVEEDW